MGCERHGNSDAETLLETAMELWPTPCWPLRLEPSRNHREGPMPNGTGLRVSTAQSPRTVPLIPVLRRFKNAITSPTSSFDGYGPAGICCRIAKRSTSTRVPCERPHFCRRVAGSEYDREEIQWIGYLLKGTDQDGRSTLAAPSPRPTT